MPNALLDFLGSSSDTARGRLVLNDPNYVGGGVRYELLPNGGFGPA